MSVPAPLPRSPGSSSQTGAGRGSVSPSGGGRTLSYRRCRPRWQQDVLQVACFHNTPLFVLWYNSTNTQIKTLSDRNAVLPNPQTLALRESQRPAFLTTGAPHANARSFTAARFTRSRSNGTVSLVLEDTTNCNAAQLLLTNAPQPPARAAVPLLGALETTFSCMWLLHAFLQKWQ